MFESLKPIMMGDKNTPIGVKQKKILSVFIYHPVYFYYYCNENKQTVLNGWALFLLDSSHTTYQFSQLDLMTCPTFVIFKCLISAVQSAKSSCFPINYKAS